MLDLIGYSTAPEDVEVAKTRLSQLMDFFLSIPWWALLGFALIATLALILVSWPRQIRATPTTRKTSAETKTPNIDPRFLRAGVLIHQSEVRSKNLGGASPYVEIRFWVFNGCGLPIRVTDRTAGTPKLRSPVKEKLEIIDEDLGGPSKKIYYPGHGTFDIRMYLTPELVQEAKEFAESPAAKAADRMFGDSGPPYIDIIFEEVRIRFRVADDEHALTQFEVPLPNYVHMRY